MSAVAGNVHRTVGEQGMGCNTRDSGTEYLHITGQV